MHIGHKNIVVWIIAAIVVVHILNTLLPLALVIGALWLIGAGVSRLLKHVT
jgi:hypothetical protein